MLLKSFKQFKGSPRPINASNLQHFSLLSRNLFGFTCFCIATLSHTQGSLYSSLHISSERGEHKPDGHTHTLFAAKAEAKRQEIIAIKTTLAKVSQIREIKLVTLKRGRDPVTDVEGRTERPDTR